MSKPIPDHYWAKRRDLVERNISQRSNRDFWQQEQWEKTAKYFHEQNVKSTKHTAWTSPEYVQNSQEAYNKQQSVEEKEDKLIGRRNRLRNLIQSEEKQWELELQQKALEAKQAEKTDMLKYYDSLAAQGPILRTFADNLMDFPTSRCKSRNEIPVNGNANGSAGDGNGNYNAATVSNQQFQVEDAAPIIPQKVLEANGEDNEKCAAEQIDQENGHQENLFQRKTFSAQNFRQQLKMKCREVICELEEDEKLLDHLNTDKTKTVQTRENAEHIRTFLQEQMIIERKRMDDVEHLFQEEAKLMLSKLSAQWNNERQLRKTLMSQFASGQKSSQEPSTPRRAEINTARMFTEDQQHANQQKCHQQQIVKKDLEEQMAYKQQRFVEEKKRDIDERDARMKAIQHDEKVMTDELSRIRISSTPGTGRHSAMHLH